MPNTESSRLNGSKSRGPITPEGKARSARNAIRHGLTSADVILEHESRTAFEAVRQSYMERHHPADQQEADLVETMVSAQWRLNRIVTTEARLFDKEVLVREDQFKKQFDSIDSETKLACAFEHLAEGKSLSLLLRYEAQLNRTYDRALKNLQQLQSRDQRERSLQDPAPPAEIPNEPKPFLIAPPNEPTEASEPPSEAPPDPVEAQSGVEMDAENPVSGGVEPGK